MAGAVGTAQPPGATPPGVRNTMRGSLLGGGLLSAESDLSLPLATDRQSERHSEPPSGSGTTGNTCGDCFLGVGCAAASSEDLVFALSVIWLTLSSLKCAAVPNRF